MKDFNPFFMILLAFWVSGAFAHGTAHHDDVDMDSSMSLPSDADDTGMDPNAISSFDASDALGDLSLPNFAGCVSAANALLFDCPSYEATNNSLANAGSFLSACNCYSSAYISTLNQCWSRLKGINIAHFQQLVMDDCAMWDIPEIPMAVENITGIFNSTPASEYINESSITNTSTIFSVPINLDEETILYNIRCYSAIQYPRYTGNLYGGLLLTYFGTIIFIGSIINFFKKGYPRVVQKASKNRFFMTFRQKVANPALFGYTHSTPVRGRFYSFIVPSRAQSIVLLGYFVMLFIFLFIKYDLIDNSPAMPGMSKGAQLGQYIAERCGIMATSQLPLIYLFAGRNNVMLFFTGWSYNTFNFYHRSISRITYFLTFVHAFSYSGSLWESDSYADNLSMPYIRCGVVSIVTFSIVLATSGRAFRETSYEIFKAIHFILIIVITISIWIHVAPMGHSVYLKVSVAVWAFDRGTRIVRVILSSVKSKAKIELHSQNILKIKMKYSDMWRPTCGHYAFITFLLPQMFFQSHPFTVYPNPDPNDDYSLMMTVRVRNGVTKKLSNYLIANNKTAIVPVLIDGPYGHNYTIAYNDTIVLMAGGVGVTAAYSYACHLKDLNYIDRKKRVIFIWFIRNYEDVNWFQEELRNISEDDSVDIRLYITDVSDFSRSQVESQKSTQDLDNKNSETTSNSSPTSDIHQFHELGYEEEKVETKSEIYNVLQASHHHRISGYGRPNISNIVNGITQVETGNTGFFVCGPAGLNDEVRSAVTNHMGAGKGRVELYVESFNW